MPTKNKLLLLLRLFLCPRVGVVAEFVFVNAAAAAAAAFDTTHQATSKKIMVDDDENDKNFIIMRGCVAATGKALTSSVV